MNNKEKTLTPEEKYFTNRYACMPYNLPTNFGTTEVITMLKEFGQQEYAAGVEAGKRESKWIPVEERLPVHYRDGKINKVWVGWRDSGTIHIVLASIVGTSGCNATDWQPLPSAPTQGKESV